MLFHVFQSLDSEEEFTRFLNLTFTEHERAMMQERWKIFDAVDRGLTQREVAKDVPCSIVTATRGAKVYRENKQLIKKLLDSWRVEQ